MMEEIAKLDLNGSAAGEFLLRVLDSLTAEIAILDHQGSIIAVNKPWKAFGDENGLGWEDYGVGRNYISVCERAEGPHSEGAKEVAVGLIELTDGRRNSLNLEYPCPSPDRERWFALDATRFTFDGSPMLVISHEEITGRKRAEREVELINGKVKLLGGITRHDVLNQLSVILGYAGLLEGMVEDEKGRRFLEKVMSASRTIQKQLEFQKDYEHLYSQAPRWTRLEDLVRTAMGACDLGSIEVHIDLKGLMVLSDPLMEKVFYNLIDNSVKHGEKVTDIRIHFDGMAGKLVYEDDGVGIPAEDKQRIFKRGFGKDTGLGLHLVREILVSSGMEIVETGKPGEGARFEITIPRKAYMFG